MQHLAHDVRYTIRSLVRVPVLSATIVLTVGLGLGATAAMIGAVWAVLVNPLPYADPGSLVWIYTDSPPNEMALLGCRLPGAGSGPSDLRCGGRVLKVAWSRSRTGRWRSG